MGFTRLLDTCYKYNGQYVKSTWSSNSSSNGVLLNKEYGADSTCAEASLISSEVRPTSFSCVSLTQSSELWVRSEGVPIFDDGLVER